MKNIKKTKNKKTIRFNNSTIFINHNINIVTNKNIYNHMRNIIDIYQYFVTDIYWTVEYFSMGHNEMSSWMIIVINEKY